jgi:hypothetical protein
MIQVVTPRHFTVETWLRYFAVPCSMRAAQTEKFKLYFSVYIHFTLPVSFSSGVHSSSFSCYSIVKDNVAVPGNLLTNQ